MSKKWWLLICVIIEIKVLELLSQHIAYLIRPVKESDSLKCKTASTLANVWPSYRHCSGCQEKLTPE